VLPAVVVGQLGVLKVWVMQPVEWEVVVAVAVVGVLLLPLLLVVVNYPLNLLRL